MLVYGDPQFGTDLAWMLNRVRRQASLARPGCLEDLRTLLVQVGQSEQGVCDARTSDADELVKTACYLTDSAATAFLSAWVRSPAPAPRIHSGTPAEGLNATIRALDCIPLHPNPPLTIKIPEGFEFYALFPEQYAAAALDWALRHSEVRRKEAVVIGIRSIGTTLSAVVAAVLRASDWQVRRFTVRPAGHPYARTLDLRAQCLRGSEFALVVDEGPGISGSSMAAVALALSREGVPAISFFPGHQGEPGSAANQEVRRCWAETPRFFTPLEQLRWEGRTLHELLRLRSQVLLGCADEIMPIDDLSAGGWRRLAFRDKACWPAVAPTFERMKLRYASSSGQAVLWKFGGFGSALNASAIHNGPTAERAYVGGSVAVPGTLGRCCGFIATPWIEGKRLAASDAADASVLSRAGEYLMHSAGPPLSALGSEQAVKRLADILFWNVKEAMGDAAAERTRFWAAKLSAREPEPTYTDGRMAPHEWLRTPGGHLYKTDNTGHNCDHTLIGAQSLLWDVAGVLVEWNIPFSRAQPFVEGLSGAGLQLDGPRVTAWQLAYAAFRLGMTKLSSSQVPDPAEQNRLRHASEFYLQTISDLLAPRA